MSQPAISQIFRRHRIRIQYQAESAECGLACLSMILWHHGNRTDIGRLRRDRPVSLKGMSLSHLIAAGNELGLAARALRVSLRELRNLKLPCILHWETDHYVVLERIDRISLTILDPSVGRRRISWEDGSRAFSGVVLELEPAAGFIHRKPQPALSLFRFLRNAGDLAETFIQAILLSVALQIFVLVVPVYMQLVIDGVVPANDANLLNLAAAAFAALAVVVACTSAFRAWLTIFISARLDFGWSAGLFRHLIRLPWQYFEKRRVGDIQSRFQSLKAIRELVAATAIASLIDAAMAFTTVFVLFVYSAKLAIISVAAVLLYLAVRLALLPVARSRSMEYTVSAARAESFFLESLRGLLAIKNFGREHRREQAWQERVGEAVSAGSHAALVSVWIEWSRQVTFGLAHVTIVWVAAGDILAGEMSVGMLVAFVAYSGMFTLRAATLTDECMKFRMARIHLDRLADIVETDIEHLIDGTNPRRPGLALAGDVSAVNVRFRYGTNEPDVLRNLNLTVRRGEHVVLTGPSGCGKTTLLKLMVGLIHPDNGRILIDGQSIADIGVAEYRRQIGTVMQNDQLLGGTLLANITFFAGEPDVARVERCCEMAGLDRDIDTMPMALQTLVGDMGDALSGGQKQRVLLARALYQQPRILFLDEATSNLDSALESETVRKLAALDITRIVVAHRRETIRHADRIIALEPVR